MFTVTFTLYEKDGMERTEALRYWGDTHAGLVKQVPGVTRYLQHHAVDAPDGTPPFLGVAHLSFADQNAFGVAAASSEFAAAIADVSNFADPDRLPTAFTDEVVVVA
jgi:uncharacterized protein (TIGR02118 family)